MNVGVAAQEPTRAPMSLGRATLTLLSGGVVAHAVPLLLGPWLTRLYSPQAWGAWQLFAAVSATLAVVACARYEFAMPLARDDSELHALRSLSLALLAASTALCVVVGVVWAAVGGVTWPLWLPVAVAVLGGVSVATMLATRAQRFRALSAASALQHGGASALQVIAGSLGLGLQALIAAPLVAAAAALVWLGLPWRDRWSWRSAEVRTAARDHRDFAQLNAPHALLGTLVAAVALAMVGASQGVAAAGFWALALRYLMAPATLIGGALSQALYARLAADAAAHDGQVTLVARAQVRQVMGILVLAGAAMTVLIAWAGPRAFAWAFGSQWADTGPLAQALAAYVGVHFVASPMGVVTMAWKAQGFALKMATIGSALFLVSLAAGLHWGGLVGAGWALAITMPVYFAVYLARLAMWPVQEQRA